jgi:hypothetical protein
VATACSTASSTPSARPASGSGAEHPQQRRGRGAQPPDQRPGDPREPLHQRGGEPGERFRPAEREPLRHEFADQQGHERQQHHECGQGDGPGRAGDRRRRVVGDPGGQGAHQPIAAVRRRQRADERDAHLHRGQEAVGAGGQLEGRLGAAIPLVGERPQSPLAAGDDRHLRPRKESVGEDQRENDEEFLDHAGGCGPCGLRTLPDR